MILQKFKNIPPPVKRMGIFAGWTAGLMLVSALLWGFTQPVRNRALLNSVNRLLIEQGEEVLLEKPLSSWGMPGQAAQSGTWFTTADSPEWAVVFTVVFDGVFSPFLAFISQNGKAGPLIPLSLHGEAMFQRLPQEQFYIYVRRIEASYALLRQARERIENE
ncbi:MAG: hypothetical protein LBP81_07220 [Treponema sp.]|jgi:hypothetical protein|nr:hypothetical protein [Treponema sp.]